MTKVSPIGRGKSVYCYQIFILIMYQIGLLLLTGPFRLVVESIAQYLKCANKNVIERLYVKLEPEFSKPFTKCDKAYLKCLSDFIPIVYNKASSLCQNLDVRIVLSDTKKRKAEFDQTRKLDVVLTNSKEENRNIIYYLDHHFVGKCDNIVKLYDQEFIPSNDLNSDSSLEIQVFKTVCLGGTFDRLHNGHKVLLSEAALRATEKLIVGVTDGPMIKRKVLWELIEPVQKRISDVTSFLLDVDPSLHYEVVPITDPYGPTVTDSDINCIVVSAETKLGGDKVNAERKNRDMKELTMSVIELVENIHKIPGEEEKLSSSTRRMHLLGTCLKSPKALSNDSYTIILQGQPLTGKSYISNCFKNLGAAVIYCNEIIASILNNNQDLKEKFCHAFNCKFLKEDNSFDYKKLLSLCLKDKERRQWVAGNLCEKVNGEVEQKLQFHRKEGAKLVLIQDSLLLDKNLKANDVNEVWSTIMPITEIAKRLSSVYNLSDDQAMEAAESMPSNEQYLKECNRTFCTQYSTDITKKQISRAWSELKLKIM